MSAKLGAVERRDVAGHIGWCHRVSRSRKYRDLDVDDVFSAAMFGAWIACERAPDGAIERYRSVVFSRKIHDLRNKDGGRRMARRCRHVETDFVDRREPRPIDVLCAREAVATLLNADGTRRPGPADPCVACGTTGGFVRKGRNRPTRSLGMCDNCYNQREGRSR